MDIYEKKYLKYKKKYLNLKQFGSSGEAESVKTMKSEEPVKSVEPTDVEFGTYQEKKKKYLGVKFNGKIYYVDFFEIKTHADAPELFISKDFEEDEKVKYGMLLLHINNTESKYDDEKFGENLNSLEIKLDDVNEFMQQLEILKFIKDQDIIFSSRPLIIKNLNEKYEELLKNKFELMHLLNLLKLKYEPIKINDSIRERENEISKITQIYSIEKKNLQKEIYILTKIKNFEEKERDKNIDKELDNLKNEVPKIDSAKFDEYVEINERKFSQIMGFFR